MSALPLRATLATTLDVALGVGLFVVDRGRIHAASACVSTQATASSALAAPIQWPSMLLMLEIGTRRSPNTSLHHERLDLIVGRRAGAVGVDEVDVALGVTPLAAIASRIARMLPLPSGCGRVMWCASQARP